MKKYISKFPHGLMFHYFHDEEDSRDDQGSLSAKDFENILKFVGIENIISPEEWIFKLKNNKLKKNDLCITFDDGLKCQYDICIPILEKYQIKCFWFIYSTVFESEIGKLDVYRYFRSKYFKSINDFYSSFFQKVKENKIGKIDKSIYENYVNERKSMFPFYSDNDLKFRFIRDEVLKKNEYENLMDKIIIEKGINIKTISKNLWLTNSNLKSLSEKGHFIGLHSYTHPMTITRLSNNEQFEEYRKNYMHINKVCNKEVLSMSHPCNSYNDNTLSILKQLGILCGFRSNMSPSKEGKINSNYLEIAREDSANILQMLNV